MVAARVPLDEAVAMVHAGEIVNAACAVGVLAAAHARDQDWAPLRPAGTPFRRGGPGPVTPA
jgi:hypothetical protein